MGSIEDYSLGNNLLVSLEGTSPRGGRKTSIYMILAREYLQSSKYLGKRLLLGTENRSLLKLMILEVSVYGKMQESEFIKILPEIYI